MNPATIIELVMQLMEIAEQFFAGNLPAKKALVKGALSASVTPAAPAATTAPTPTDP